MRVHVLGVCGTFMGGIALLARDLGFEVSGADRNAWPPMSNLLADSGIPLYEGYDPAWLDPAPDLLVIGNALSRGNPVVEAALARGIPYCSGPEFLAREVLPGRWVLAVSGTHGKTTTSAMLAQILDYAGLAPGFLIGGAAHDFPVPARLGNTPFFVVEADEYDSAFFDKRSKFVHYRPRTLVINNLEFDHADIFPDLDAIKRQFHHLVRTVPGNGLIIAPRADAAIEDVLEMGCWTPTERFHGAIDGGVGDGWASAVPDDDSRGFTVLQDGKPVGMVHWQMMGRHNIDNGLAALLAARHAGVPPAVSIEALTQFRGVRRRLEQRGTVNGVTVYDDFAHHPTAIATTLEGLRAVIGRAPLVAVLEMRSNTMKLGVHKAQLAPALAEADEVLLYRPPDLAWSLEEVADAVGPHCRIFDSVQAIIDHVVADAGGGAHVLVMSNGGFENIHDRLIEALSNE